MTPDFVPAPTRANAADIAERAERIYREKIRPLLTDADKGKYLTINVETGTYEMDTDSFAGSLRAWENAGRKSGVLFTMRVGYRAAASFVPAKDNEIARW